MQSEMVAAVEREMETVLHALEGPLHRAMGEMVRYHLGWERDEPDRRGKRIRPLLALMVCDAAGGRWQQAVPVAAAIELIHNFSLIHDDIEDASTTRRGKATLWKKWDLPQALNTGDALLILSQKAPHRLAANGIPSETILAVLRVLDEACLKLTIGQHLDLAFERRELVSVDEYLQMIDGKTASLLGAATESGSMLAGAAPQRIRSFREFGLELGVAFQIEDDLLGIWGEPNKTGKPAGDDLSARKKSLPVVHGLEHSSEFRLRWKEMGAGSTDVDALRRLLREAGSQEFARRLAAERTARALSHLDDAQPQAASAQVLRMLAALLLGREK